MDCPNCDEPTVVGPVPEGHREYAPEGAAAVAACTRCLTVTPADPPGEAPTWSTVSEALPDGDRAVSVLLFVSLLDSLATNRADIEALVADLERDGVDPFATVDRLAEDPTLDPVVGLKRRRHQLEQLL